MSERNLNHFVFTFSAETCCQPPTLEGEVVNLRQVRFLGGAATATGIHTDRESAI